MSQNILVVYFGNQISCHSFDFMIGLDFWKANGRIGLIRSQRLDDDNMDPRGFKSVIILFLESLNF